LLEIIVFNNVFIGLHFLYQPFGKTLMPVFLNHIQNEQFTWEKVERKSHDKANAEHEHHNQRK